MLRCKLKIVSNNGNFEVGVKDGLRSFPLNSIIDTLDVKINGGSISDSVGDRLHAMLTYNNDAQKRTNCWTQSPSMPDYYQEYKDWVDYGSSKNALSDYGENSLEDTRGGFPADSSTATEFVYTLTEPLMMSPFLSGCEEESEGFTNINQIDISIRWSPILEKVWSHDVTGTSDAGVTVTFQAAPELLVQYLTPDMNMPIPSLQVLPYSKHNDYVKSMGTILSSNSQTQITDTIKLNQIPRKLMLFARRARGTMSSEISDNFARIDKISLLWNNESNLLSSASTQDLHRISRRNGCNLTWSQWNKYRGSVFVAEFGTDIGLAQGLSPGVLGQFTLSAQVDVTNVSDTANDFELFMCTVLDGSVEISENSLAVSLGNLTVDDVLKAEGGDEIHHTHVKGGSFFTGMKHFINKLSRGVQKGARAVEGVAPAIGTFNPQVGAALGTSARGVRELASLARKASGGRLSGGVLSSRLRRY
jgi:hypothetical protein